MPSRFRGLARGVGEEGGQAEVGALGTTESAAHAGDGPAEASDTGAYRYIDLYELLHEDRCIGKDEELMKWLRGWACKRRRGSSEAQDGHVWPLRHSLPGRF